MPNPEDFGAVEVNTQDKLAKAMGLNPDEQAYENKYEAANKDKNIASIRSELAKTSDPKARQILMDELKRVQGTPEAFGAVEVDPTSVDVPGPKGVLKRGTEALTRGALKAGV